MALLGPNIVQPPNTTNGHNDYKDNHQQCRGNVDDRLRDVVNSRVSKVLVLGVISIRLFSHRDTIDSLL